MQWIPCSMVQWMSIECSGFPAMWHNGSRLHHTAWNPLHSLEIHWATLHGIHCIQLGSIVPRCMESTAFNQNPLHHTAWNPLHSIGIHLTPLHGIQCINRDAFYHAAWNPLHSVMLHGMHYIQSGCFGPCCIKSTAFNRDALGHAPWNQLHSIKLDGIHCI